MPLSSKQMEYLALAWQCFDVEPKIDYEKFKDIAGLASAASARELLRITKKKLKEEYGALSGGIKAANNGDGKACSVKKAPRTPAKRGRSAKKADSEVNGGAEEDEHDKEEHTPVPKRAKTPVNSKKMTNGVKPEPSADAESDDDADYLI